MKQVHLICNAHIDPVWQWEWDEGLAETLSTFRVAADFCEQFDGFVFNHNEALLYQWTEEYEPALFEKIQGLAAAGKWHIMGGWFLQPDCNMPSGESIARQITTGRKYFHEKFGVLPSTAVNVDSFGHNRGLVQLLKKAGYDSYIITRPTAAACNAPAADFAWQGYDGSAIMVHLADAGYNSLLGKAAEKIEGCVQRHQDMKPQLILWGVGNHGGGPSRVDLNEIKKLAEKMKGQDIELLHSTPEDYFAALDISALPRHEGNLTHVNAGCYTTQVRIKQLHKKLENLLFQTEKMAAAAELQTGASIDLADIKKAEALLLFNEFHDILPGTSVQRAEDAAIGSLLRALDILQHQRMKAFMALVAHFDAAAEGTFPVFVYNPHPYICKRIAVCEFQLGDQNWDNTVTDFDVYINGKRVPSQLEKEDSNLPLDWRKRVAFLAELPPFTAVYAECRPKILQQRTDIPVPGGDCIKLCGKDASASIDLRSGLIRDYAVNGETLLTHAAQLLVLQDSEDPWGMTVDEFTTVCGEFTLATAEEAGEIAGLLQPLAPVRIIEQGELRTTAEAIFVYKRSSAIVRYTMGIDSSEIGLSVRLLWSEPNKMVKCSLPCAFNADSAILGGMFGRDSVPFDGKEQVHQKWQAAVNGSLALTVIDTGTYASSFLHNAVQLTLLRSAAYCAHPIEGRTILPQDRFSPRIDIGERIFSFTLNGGAKEELLRNVEMEAAFVNEQPVALSYFPAKKETAQKPPAPFLTIDNTAILLSAFKKSEQGHIVRLYNSADSIQAAVITIQNREYEVPFLPREIKTFRYAGQAFTECRIDEMEL